MGVLFISHSSRDNDQAIKVRDWLRSNGWGEVFLDLDPAHGLAPGQRWQEELKRAGENCAAVIVLVSPNWVASRWCQTEFLVADQLGKRIFPVFIAPTSFDDLPLELKAKFQLADISTPEKESEGFQRLSTGLKRAGLDPKSFDWPPPDEPQRSVYRGLSALDVQDAAIFFGRDAAITQGLDELRRLRDGAPKRIMVILGASGAGKSSFLRAGLIARLKRDEENFLVLPVVRPERAAITGAQGLTASLSAALGRQVALGSAADLAQAFIQARAPVLERLQRHAEAARDTHRAKPPTIIIPLDQGEELFGAENIERTSFCAMLGEALAQDGNALVIVTIRSDSYEPLQIEPHLAGAGQLLLNLPPIAAGSFQEVIEGPARLAKPLLSVEPALTQHLLADLSAGDALPLLAFTLERLQIQFGQDGKLSLSDYRDKDKLNGIEGAIQSAVNAVLGAHPSKSELALARRLFVPALVKVDQEGVKRRVARRQDLPADAQALADRFVAQRLLVTDAGNIEVAHEAILRQWPALASWITEERGALVVLDSVRAAAREWRDHAERRGGRRGESWLAHRGDRLNDAQKISARGDFGSVVDNDMHAYLGACLKEERKAAASRLRAQGFAVVSALAVFAFGYGYTQRAMLEPMIASWTKYKRFAHGLEELAAARPGTMFQDCRPDSGDCPTMVVIPGGTFMMDAPEHALNDQGQIVAVADARRRVSISSFAVSRTEITFADWQACIIAGGCDGYQPERYGWEGDNRPVINVSWNDAQKYVTWLSRMTGHDYRMLTEAEWEYAARAVLSADDPRMGEKWSFGNDESQLRDHAWFVGNSDGRTHAVATLRPNRFGLFDMHGNVWEWVEGCFAEYDPARASAVVKTETAVSAPSEDALTCFDRTLRGGSWQNDAETLRSGSRRGGNPGPRDNDNGFRVARTL